MAATRSQAQLAELAAFVQQLYELGSYATWKEFADDAKISAPQLSDFQRGEAEPSGYNLLKLIRASAQRAGTEQAEAAVRSLPPQPRLEGIQDDVASLLEGQGEILSELRELRGGTAVQSTAVPKQKAAGRKKR